ncbi:hypothetical protein EB118_03535 [bacterium]|nr:hypothetical protein [bacterium]NDD82738.1 hypothetical protein [bacterium]NDG29158.1 hypothetical protein [bacterium]
MDYFKAVFFSEDNTNHILKKVIKDQSLTNLQFRKSKEDLVALQKFVYNNFYTRVSTDVLQPEKVMVILNNMCVKELETIVQHHTRSFTLPVAPTSQNAPPLPQPIAPTSQDALPQPVAPKEQTSLPLPQPVAPTSQPLPTPVVSLQNISAPKKIYKTLQGNGVAEVLRLNISQCKAVWIDEFVTECNFYNVTKDNNQFTLQDATDTTVCYIPTGYYQVHDLINVIKKTLDEHCTHKYEIEYHKHKNKVSIWCKELEYFHMTSKLLLLLGFSQTSYSFNNLYTSESFVPDADYVTITIKMFVNGEELTSDQNVCFEKIRIHVSDLFGKEFHYKSDWIFDFFSPTDIKNMYIELDVQNEFEMVVGFLC